MRLALRTRLRPLGGLGGIALALAGGFGVAVGTYSLPEVNHAHFGLGGYGPGTQAVAVWKGNDGDDYLQIRIDAWRRTSAGQGGTVGPDGSLQAGGGYDVGQGFFVWVQRCPPPPEDADGDWCEYAAWSGEFPPGAFEFDPALRSAHLSGRGWCEPWAWCGEETMECSFDITWTGTGEAAPIASFGTGGGRTSQGEEGTGFGSSAGVSRVAPADIDSCFGSFADAPGYLSVGIVDGFGGGANVH